MKPLIKCESLFCWLKYFVSATNSTIYGCLSADPERKQERKGLQLTWKNETRLTKQTASDIKNRRATVGQNMQKNSLFIFENDNIFAEIAKKKHTVRQCDREWAIYSVYLSYST